MNKLQKLYTGATAAGTAALLSASPVFAQLGTLDIPQQGYAKSVGSLISSILNLVMLVAALLVFMYLILGGIEWITSGGDKSKTEGARNKITSAIIGLIVLAASYALLQLALTFLGFSGGLEEVFNRPVRPITQ